MRRRARVALIAASLLGPLTLGALGLAAAGDAPGTPYVVDIRIRYSAFEPQTFDVPHGRPVVFVLRNDDPIDHEWIVGDALVHQVHRTGTEEHHASRPTEVSIPALSTRRATITFDRPVTWQFICHLPGHEAYGMVGVVTVR